MPDESVLVTEQPQKRLSLIIFAIGVISILGSLALAIRLFWEMTWLTWEQGPQMIGFSLAHGSGALLFLFPVLLALWLLVAIVTMIVWKVKRQKLSKQNWFVTVCAVVVLGLLFLPSNFWDAIFVRRLASSSHAPEFLVYGACNGEMTVVRGLLKFGIAVDATNREGTTALHCAAGSGSDKIVTYLIDHGANVNAVNLWGDSPLQLAISSHRDRAASILTAHGAKVIKGDEAQRQRAAHEIVQQDIERMAQHK